MEELLDTYDKFGNFVGVKPKSFCYGKNPGVYYKPIWIWIVNSKDEILLQRRAKTKKYFPDKWDHSVGGHVKSGEKSTDACQREALEELGLYFESERFEFIGEFLEQIYWHIGQVYVLRSDIDISKILLKKDEVSEVKWFNFKDFNSVLFSDEFGPFENLYKLWVVDKLKNFLKIQ